MGAGSGHLGGGFDVLRCQRVSKGVVLRQNSTVLCVAGKMVFFSVI